METPPFSDTIKIEPSSITPDHVRGLSLGRVTEEFGTIGLYSRIIDSLERAGFDDNELVQFSLQLGLTLHSDDYRTNGHYTDHLMRVTLRMVEDFGIRDSNLIAAGPLHDAFEDHPKDIVLALTGEELTDPHQAREVGRTALAAVTNEEVVHIVESVTNPPVPEGADKIDIYTHHTRNLVLRSPLGRVLKLADFIDNAGGNHATIGDKQRRLDEKYIRQYRIHKMGLFLPNSLITGKERQQALHMLSKGHARALGRLAGSNSQNEIPPRT
jgi:hypothetical protein